MNNLFRRYEFYDRATQLIIGFCFSRNRDHALKTFSSMIDVDQEFEKGIYCVDATHKSDGYFEYLGDKNEISNPTT